MPALSDAELHVCEMRANWAVYTEDDGRVFVIDPRIIQRLITEVRMYRHPEYRHTCFDTCGGDAGLTVPHAANCPDRKDVS